jgi:predicted small secreted protein
MKKTMMLFLLLASGYLMSGCNTMNGLGKDVERLGEKVQDKSR